MSMFRVLLSTPIEQAERDAQLPHASLLSTATVTVSCDYTTGYTLCEFAAFVGGALHLANPRFALTEQSALARLNASIQTRLRLIM